MRSNFVLIATIFLMAHVSAEPVPEKVEVTSENSNEIGFFLEKIATGNNGVILVQLNFPPEVGGNLKAKRVQTYLFDLNGKEITSTSADYTVSETNPSLVAHFNPSTHDMALVIQYFCNGKAEQGCAKAYTISSVNKYLITRPANVPR